MESLDMGKGGPELENEGSKEKTSWERRNFADGDAATNSSKAEGLMGTIARIP